jgi:hypothetical protein
MTFQDFIENNKRYIDVSKSKETSTSYVIVLKGKYYFYHWTPQTSYSKKSISIDKSEWRSGVAGETIMTGFFDVSTSQKNHGKLLSMTGVCSETDGGDDYLVISPKAFAGHTIDWLNYAWVQDVIDVYHPRMRRGHQKSGEHYRQGPAGMGATKGKASTFVYAVREVKSISEKSGLPIYGKAKEVSVRRVDQKSADNYVKSMYSYKKTGKLYFVELKSLK